MASGSLQVASSFAFNFMHELLPFHLCMCSVVTHTTCWRRKLLLFFEVEYHSTLVFT